jgi:intracellular septation protein A
MKKVAVVLVLVAGAVWFSQWLQERKELVEALEKEYFELQAQINERQAKKDANK